MRNVFKSSVIGLGLFSLSGLLRADESGLVEKYGFDRPLLLDVEQFRNEARLELTEIFGEIGESGVIYQKDRPAKEGNCFYDQNRAYYLTDVDSSKFLLGTEYKAAFVTSTLGEVFAGFAKVVNVGSAGRERNDIFYAFPSYMVLLEQKSTLAERREAAESLVEALKEIAPGLEYEARFTLISMVTILPPSMTSGKPLTAEDFVGLSRVIDYLKTYEGVEAIELNGEGGDFYGAGELRKFEETKEGSIDLNSLRDESLVKLEEGVAPCDGLVPFLPKPFGTGERVEIK